jgi:hypothetical protein
MKTHKIEVKFSETPFDEIYFTLEDQKTVRLTRYPDGSNRGVWNDMDIEDRNGDESVRFSLTARGVVGDSCQLEICVDGKELKSYKELVFADNGWVTIVDIIYIQ